MSVGAVASAKGRSEWLVPGLLVLLSLVPAAGGAARLGDLATATEITAENARFFAMPLPVVMHILAAVPYSIVGAFQFSAGFRRRNRSWHRAAGRVIGVLGLVVAISGLWMTLTYPWPTMDRVAVYVLRLVFGSTMALSIVLGIDAVRRRDFAAHGEWMIRAYAIGMGAGTQVLTHLPWFILVGQPTVGPRAVMMGTGWVINVLVAELVIRRGRGSRSVTARPRLTPVLAARDRYS